MNEARFWERVDKTDTCWLWTGAKSQGYGNCWFGNRFWRAHRVAFSLTYLEINIAGVEIDHMCHVRSCVNPDHLRPVTHKENQENRSGAQRNSSSGVRGVRWESDRRKWLARVKHNGRTINIGRFDTLESAAEAVRAKRIELFTHNEKDKNGDKTGRSQEIARAVPPVANR